MELRAPVWKYVAPAGRQTLATRRFALTSKTANKSDAERKKAFLKLLLELLRKRMRRSGK